MVSYSPQLKDRLLMTLGRQYGPAADDLRNRIIADETAKSFAEQKQAEAAQGQLNLAKLGLAYGKGLGEKRLAQGASQFEKGLEFSKKKFQDTLSFDREKFNTNLAIAMDESQRNRRLSGTASLISLGGLGVEGIRSYQNRKRAEQIGKVYDEMIGFYKKQKTPMAKFYADWLEALRID